MTHLFDAANIADTILVYYTCTDVGDRLYFIRYTAIDTLTCFSDPVKIEEILLMNYMPRKQVFDSNVLILN